jgi:hypothetical protein
MVMRFTLVPVLLFLAAVCQGADDSRKVSSRTVEEKPMASRRLEGDTSQFPANSLVEGVKATVAVLESCHSSDAETYTAAGLKKAQQGDHVRLVFPKPITVTVLRDEFDVSEVVYADGVFWLRCGAKVVRSTKYEFEKWRPFESWFRQLLP